MINRNYKIVLGGAGLVLLSACTTKQQDRPNILMLTCEDISPFLGCYGDSLATTPCLDILAEDAILYENAFANAPVSGPSRSTMITGCYATSIQTDPMGARVQLTEDIRLYPEFLRKAGYYCTNNDKTNYEIFRSNGKERETDAWDRCDPNASHQRRKPGQPFFAIYNKTTCHESCIHSTINSYNMLHRPDSMKLAAYHPNTPEIRHDYAQFYDFISLTDSWVGGMIAQLKKEGLWDNTIIFFYSDHGGIIGRSKRFANESGLRIPLLVRVPDKYKHLAPQARGTHSNRLVSLVDIAPTVLNLAGIEIPDYMQGTPFLGEDIPEDPQYVYGFESRMDEKFDLRRTVRDEKFRYIRNFFPYKAYSKHINFLWKAPSMRSWEKCYEEGLCNEAQSIFWNPKPTEELYLVNEDRDEVNNLIGDPQYKADIERMRAACDAWMLNVKDAGFIPEAMQEDYVPISVPFTDFSYTDKYEIDKILGAANASIYMTAADVDKIYTYLNDQEAAIRFWGLNYILNIQIREDYDISSNTRLISKLNEMLQDPIALNRIKAAQCIMMRQPNKKVAQVMIDELDNNRKLMRYQTLDAIIELCPDHVKWFENALDHVKYAKGTFGNHVLSQVTWIKQKYLCEK